MKEKQALQMTNWVDIPNTQPRGAYLILARGEDDEDSAYIVKYNF